MKSAAYFWLNGKEIFQNQKNIVVKSESPFSIKIKKTIIHPKKWTAETPSFYQLILILKDGHKNILEVTGTKVGFRKLEIKNGQLLVNRVPITLRGATDMSMMI